MAKAIIVLEDGTSFEGRSFGAEGEKIGEVIFNTQIIGWQEMITDPSYQDKIISIGYPHVGNYGINPRCFESETAHASALIVKEYSRIYSNWQATGPLDEFMKKNGVMGLEGIDTRALTIHLREHGEMRGIVSTKIADKDKLVEKARQYQVPDLVSEIRSPKTESNAKSKITIINLGVNNSTLARFPGANVVSYDISAEKLLEMKPEQVVISSGPGDPRKLTDLVQEIKKLVGKVKLYGIQNGACVLALALGCSVYRMKVGHHGMNQPVVEPDSGKGEITSQNHSYGIDRLASGVEAAHINLNDRTVEKFIARSGKCVGTLYFPVDERGKLPKDYKLV